uniref:Putative response regulator receiver protein n=1 Tax=Magnetococcus massalia (strain MO-1) TaxID=451514 RepID=A0A1S7LN50_MAGMO|nr:Putative response regulator receiver protein [Candidatus Magnetococcus massalia]
MLIDRLAQELKPLVRANASVLYAEDHNDMRRLVIEKLFRPLNIRVKETVDGFAAAQAFSNGHYDMVVTDFDMPNMTGTEVLKHIRKTNARIPVLFLTSLPNLHVMQSIKDEHVYVLPKQSFNRFLDSSSGQDAEDKRIETKDRLVRFMEDAGVVNPTTMPTAQAPKCTAVPVGTKAAPVGGGSACSFPTLGVDLVDQQHRQLFQLMFALDNQIKSKNSQIELMILALFNYANKHLADEEALLSRHGYPDLANHQQLHKKLVGDLENKAAAVKSAASPDDKFKRADELKDFIKNWLISHIGDEDKKHCEWLLSKGIK